MRVADLTEAGCDFDELVLAALAHMDPGPGPAAFVVTEEQMDVYRDTLWARWQESQEFRKGLSGGPVPSATPAQLRGVPLVSKANAHPALRSAAHAASG